FAKTAPTVIMLAGLQGSGKTTFAGKLAKQLESDGQQGAEPRAAGGADRQRGARADPRR
ncbi:hypothetical protein CTI14_61565, partial [Methylobacterium radiotolerans]